MTADLRAPVDGVHSRRGFQIPPKPTLDRISRLGYSVTFVARRTSHDERSALLREDLLREHIPYEIDMMRATLDLVLLDAIPAGLIKIALMDSFAVHARALINFLQGRKGSSASFFTADYWPFHDQAIAASVVSKINLLVANITEAKVRAAADKLTTNEMAAARRILDAEIEKFLECLTPESRAIWRVPRK